MDPSDTADTPADRGEQRERRASGGRGGRSWIGRTWSRQRVPIVVFALTAAVYALVAGPRTDGPSPNNHFVHLAESYLAGQLGQLGDHPPGYNDWACFDTGADGVCPPDAFQNPDQDYRWYVSFPPFPAMILTPMVAIFGRDFSDPLFWAIFAGLPPAFLFGLLRRLREEQISDRTTREDLSLIALFAFGSVYFFSAVQGSVWFCAHIVASLLLTVFLYCAIGVRSPIGAGVALGLCFMTRPSTAPFALFFLFEAIRVSRAAPSAERGGSYRDAAARAGTSTGGRLHWTRETDWPRVLSRCAVFASPILAVGGLMMWMNQARFADPFEFGHSFLMIRWRPRIEKWGLFNFHYFAKNLSVYLAGLPWLSSEEPFVLISRHGLALWVTSPGLLALLWPKRVTGLMRGLFVTTAIVAVLDLCYQNSGWVQFGYRFSLDYMPALIVLLALSRRRFGGLWIAALVFAVAVNLFGAITFDRVGVFYDDDNTQERLFQPD